MCWRTRDSLSQVSLWSNCEPNESVSQIFLTDWPYFIFFISPLTNFASSKKIRIVSILYVQPYNMVHIAKILASRNFRLENFLESRVNPATHLFFNLAWNTFVAIPVHRVKLVWLEMSVFSILWDPFK